MPVSRVVVSLLCPESPSPPSHILQFARTASEREACPVTSHMVMEMTKGAEAAWS